MRDFFLFLSVSFLSLGLCAAETVSQGLEKEEPSFLLHQNASALFEQAADIKRVLLIEESFYKSLVVELFVLDKCFPEEEIHVHWEADRLKIFYQAKRRTEQRSVDECEQQKKQERQYRHVTVYRFDEGEEMPAWIEVLGIKGWSRFFTQDLLAANSTKLKERKNLTQ